MIYIGEDSRAEVAITEASGSVYVGSGSISDSGALEAVATKQGGTDTATVSGQFKFAGGAPYGTGTISGVTCGCAWTSKKVAGPGENAFTGAWSGTYSGTTSGTWTVTVSSDGHVTGSAITPTRTLPLTGTVSSIGVGTLTGSGGGTGGSYTVSWKGTFRIVSDKRVASGTWTSTTGDLGTWEGQHD